LKGKTMKKLTLAFALSAATLIPSMATAQDMFPNLTYPTTWAPKPTVSQDTVVKPIIPLFPTEE
jgi:hypothetical protein